MKKICFYLLAIVLLFACEPGQTPVQAKLLSDIAALEKQLAQPENASKNRELALELVEKTMQYAKDYPQDERTPALLFKAGEVAKNAKEYGKAVELWGQVFRDYPKHPKAPMALFQQGQTFDANLGDQVMAAKYYKQFLKTHPEDAALVNQAKQRLSTIKDGPKLKLQQYETE
jgi:tetratricopeptide (TPR) repeat protein